jgi:hypothetical protein
MGDLYFDDLESASYTDEMILADVETLVKSGQREGSVIEYKSDVSDQDNWPQTVAAFANSFGGLILFGVEGKGDQPRRVTGFEPKGVEIRTKLTSMVIDRIQPRPDFSVRVITFDKPTDREVALLRVGEGRRPPYLHSKGQEHRVYLRVGAQKAEADYLQLTALFEKRSGVGPIFEGSVDGAFGTDTNFFVPDPNQSTRGSAEHVKFVITLPSDVHGPRLSGEVEHRFSRCIQDIRGNSGNIPTLRSRDATVFRVSGDAYREQRFALSAFGATGFMSYPAIRTERGLQFVPEHFCKQLLDFLSISSLFHERALRFYGAVRLSVRMLLPGGASIFDGLPGRTESGGAYLFEPPLNHIAGYAEAEMEIDMHPALPNRLSEMLEFFLIDLARRHGSVLSAGFRGAVKQESEMAAAQLVRARTA